MCLEHTHQPDGSYWFDSYLTGRRYNVLANGTWLFSGLIAHSMTEKDIALKLLCVGMSSDLIATKEYTTETVWLEYHNRTFYLMHGAICLRELCPSRSPIIKCFFEISDQKVSPEEIRWLKKHAKQHLIPKTGC